MVGVVSELPPVVDALAGEVDPELVAGAAAELHALGMELEANPGISFAAETMADRLQSTTRLLGMFADKAERIGAVELPQKIKRFPGGLMGLLERTGVRKGTELVGLGFAFGSLDSAVGELLVQTLYANGMELSESSMDAIKLAISGLLVLGIGKGKGVVTEVAQRRNGGLLSAVSNSFAEKPFLMTAALVSALGATNAATVGFTKVLAGAEKVSSFGEQAKRDMAPLLGQVEASQMTIQNVFTQLETTFKGFAELELNGDTVRPASGAGPRSSGRAGFGPQYVGKMYAWFGRDLLSVPEQAARVRTMTPASQEQAKQNIRKVQEVRTRLGMTEGQSVVDFLRQRPSVAQFEAQRTAVMSEVAALTRDIEKELATPLLTRFGKFVTGDLGKYGGRLAAVLGLDASMLSFAEGEDARAIPRRAERIIAMIRDLDQKREGMITDMKSVLAVVSGDMMQAVGATGQNIPLEQPQLDFTTAALDRIMDAFPKDSSLLLPSEEDWRNVAIAVERSTGVALDSASTWHRLGYYSLVAFLYGGVVDSNITPFSVAYQGRRRRELQRDMPEKLKELEDAEDAVAQEVASFIHNGLQKYGEALFGIKPINQDSLVPYIRFELHQLALQEPGMHGNSWGFMKSALGMGESFLRALPPEEIEQYNEGYVRFLQKIQTRLDKGDYTVLDGLVSRLYPQFAVMREEMAQVLSVSEQESEEEVKEGFDRIKSAFMETYNDHMAARAEYLKYRIVATREVEKELQGSNTTEQFYKAGVVVPLSGKGDVSITSNEAVNAYTLAALADQRAREERELAHIMREYRGRALRDFEARQGKGGVLTIAVPGEFSGQFFTGAANPTEYGLEKDMLDAYRRERAKAFEREADADQLAAIVSSINTEAVPEMIRQYTQTVSSDVRDVTPTFSLVYDARIQGVTVRAALEKNGEVVGSVVYPHRVPNVNIPVEEHARAVAEWFRVSGIYEFEARALHQKQIEKVRELEERVQKSHPDMKIPLLVGSGELSLAMSLAQARAEYQRQALRLEVLIESPLSAQEIGAFHGDTVALQTGGGASRIDLESIAKELPDVQVMWDASTDELLFTKGAGSISRFFGKIKGTSEVRLPLRAYVGPDQVKQLLTQ